MHTSTHIQGSKRAKASGADFKPFLPLPPPPPLYAKHFLTIFTLISKMISQGLISAHGLRNWNPDIGVHIEFWKKLCICQRTQASRISRETHAFWVIWSKMYRPISLLLLSPQESMITSLVSFYDLEKVYHIIPSDIGRGVMSAIRW